MYECLYAGKYVCMYECMVPYPHSIRHTHVCLVLHAQREVRVLADFQVFAELVGAVQSAAHGHAAVPALERVRQAEGPHLQIEGGQQPLPLRAGQHILADPGPLGEPLAPCKEGL